MSLQTIRLKPPQPVSLQGYDLDAVAIEYEPSTGNFDFRLELGQGLNIYWALPAAPNDRLRLIHVDSAVMFVEEPSLVDDPFVGELQLRFEGALATLKDESELLSVELTISTHPPAYTCGISTQGGPKKLHRTVVLAWTGKCSARSACGL